MSEWLQAFILGNQAILTNVCLLPLYPGLIAFLSGNAGEDSQGRVSSRWLGALVLTGVLSMMLLVGFVLVQLQQSFGAVLPILLPVIYAVVIVLGVLMLSGRNPFARMSVRQSPILRNRAVSAYAYGLLLGPMTLPCTGPIITTAFVLGAGNGFALADGLLYFLFFGLGFGWPLVVLPLLAGATQKRFTGWLSRHHRLLEVISGVLLIGIGVFGIVTEVIPNL